MEIFLAIGAVLFFGLAGVCVFMSGTYHERELRAELRRDRQR